MAAAPVVMLSKPQFVELLGALQGGNNDVRNQAESLYEQLRTQHPEPTMGMLCQIINSADLAESLRSLAAVLMRKCMIRGSEKHFLWARMSLASQQQLAAELLRIFEQEQLKQIQKQVGEIVSKLAEYVCDPSDPRGHLGNGGWPDLLPAMFRFADASKNSNLNLCECALRMLGDLVETLKDQIVANGVGLQQLLQSCMGNLSLEIRAAGLLLVCSLVNNLEKKAWTPLLATTSVLLQILREMADHRKENMLAEAIQAFIETSTVAPDFFKVQLQQSLEPAKFMAEVAKTRAWDDATGLRNMGAEWIVNYIEKRPKWLLKSLPALPALGMEVCMEMMLEIDDSEVALKEWMERMGDEEGEEDEDEIYHAGEEYIDRIVQALEVDKIAASLFGLIGTYSRRPDWQAKHAALAAIKQTVEYVEEKEHIDQMAKLLVAHMDHAHARVRYISLHALGQLSNDQSPHFQESSHKEVLPMLLQKMDDPVDRVAAMAMSAFVSFGEELDNALMLTYSSAFMHKFVQRLQTSQHRGVKEECITSIAVIAGVMGKDFMQFYDGIMPMLKQFILQATGDKEKRLRGKAFECMSLLGIVVGKDKFLPDARDALNAMMSTTCADDDIQREYIKEAMERIVQCLKEGFKEFVPHVLPKMLKDIQMEDTTPGPDDDDDLVSVSRADGKIVKVKSSKFEEIQRAVQLICTMAHEMKGAYFDFVQGTAEALLPLLSNSDQDTYLVDEARNVTLSTWGELISCAKLGAEERGLVDCPIPRQLLQECTRITLAMMDKETDAETLAPMASLLADCIKNAGPAALHSSEVPALVVKTFELVDQSLSRTQEARKLISQYKSSEGAVAEVADGEGDDVEEDEEEAQCRRNYEEMLGAMMKVAPDAFNNEQILQGISQKMTTWLAVPENKVLALYLACDVVENLKDLSVKLWPVFMPAVFVATSDPDPLVVTAAVYCINVAAPLQAFAEAAPEAYRRLATIVGGPKPKKRDKKAKLAFENAVAALLNLVREKEQSKPAEIQVWTLILNGLPLRYDEEEAKKVHASLVQMLMAENSGLVTNLGKVLSLLAEVYNEEAICTEDTSSNILTIFKSIPQHVLMQQAGQLTEKQQKKVEKMLQG